MASCVSLRVQISKRFLCLQKENVGVGTRCSGGVYLFGRNISVTHLSACHGEKCRGVSG